MGKGYKHGAGGVGGLNLRVVGGAKPATPKENTIWVNTTADITSYALRSTEPAAPAEGMVWLKASASAVVPIDLGEKANELLVYPAACYQYLSGVWTAKTAETYIGGAWLPWVVHLFNAGTVNAELTGGIYGVITSEAITFGETVTKSENFSFTTKSKVDLTEYNTLTVRFMGSTSAESVYLRLFAADASFNGANKASSSLTKYATADSPFNKEERVLALDVSELSGEYYLGYAWGVYSTASGNRAFNGYIYEWWLS